MLKNPFKIGDPVILRADVLGRHAKSVPAHAGFTTEQFAWRAILAALDGRVGTIDRLFEGSRFVNVKFKAVDGKDEVLIGIDFTELTETLSQCDECGAKCEKIIGCPDGAEVCPDCFDKGAH